MSLHQTLGCFLSDQSRLFLLYQQKRRPFSSETRALQRDGMSLRIQERCSRTERDLWLKVVTPISEAMRSFH